MVDIPKGRTRPAKVSDEIIEQWEKDWDESQKEIAVQQEKLSRNLRIYRESARQKDRQACRRIAADISIQQDKISGLRFEHQDDLYWIKWGKKMLNAQARRAYLNRGKFDEDYLSPFPEVRG